MAWIHDWRTLAISAAVLWGFWGLLAKVASTGLDWRTALLFVLTAHFLTTFAVTCRKANYEFTWFHVAAMGAGFMSSCGAICMYRALQKADASLVITISAQYVLVTAVLSWLILRESMSWQKVTGLLLAVVAIVLLSWPNQDVLSNGKRRSGPVELQHAAGDPDGPPRAEPSTEGS